MAALRPVVFLVLRGLARPCRELSTLEASVMSTWTRGAIAVIAILSTAAIGLPALAQTQGGNGPPPRPTPQPPRPRPPLRRPIPRIIHGGRLTLYARPHYRGQEVTLTRSTSNLRFVGFRDPVMSLRVHGRWRVCEHTDYRGRCSTMRHDQSTIFGLTGHSSSARFEGR